MEFLGGRLLGVCPRDAYSGLLETSHADIDTVVAFGVTPALTLHYTTKGFVNWIYLRLPTHARETSKTAMHYAHNLPPTAKLLIHSKRMHLVGGVAEVSLADLIPRRQAFPPSNVQVAIDNRLERKGPWFSPDPLAYYVKPQTTTDGLAARDTIPGIWEPVYKKIMGLESEAMGKWKNTL